MGGCVVLHPQASFKQCADNMLRTPIKPRRRTSTKQRNLMTKRNKETAASKNVLVMGQVKILKRGEELTTLSDKDLVADQQLSEVSVGIVLRTNKKILRHKRLSSPEVVLETEDLGPSRLDLENIKEGYAGYGIEDSPSPSLVPLPRFL